MPQKICVVGLGYIGLPTAAILADNGYDVVGVDINKEVIDNLNKGKIIIEEPNLNEIVKDVVSKKKLIGKYSPGKADIFIICVPTPIREDKKADMTYVIDATKRILPHVRKNNIVILESTSPVGTTENIIKPILEKTNLKVGQEIYLGYCPERVIPGRIIEELSNNNRIIGGINEISALKIKEIYESFVNGQLYTTDTNTAEMVKLTENTFRDVNIALANELLKVCDDLGINVWNLIKYCNKHPRVNILDPGPGVGGHCLAVDPWFIVEASENLANIIKLSRQTNDSMPQYVFDKVEKLTKDLEGSKKISILGMTYKKDIDDMRESPIVHLVDILKENNYQISIYDPYVSEYEDLEKDLLKCVKDSDLLVLGVDHCAFKNIQYEEVYKAMKGKVILDTRKFLDEDKMKEIGFIYKLLGYKK
ncbi:nucleotide sugar dehydrogenase [Romboutsia sp.]|uniref:nucleotide sugar dehydrogenase n=1 Tax=Romboutsia sp. TaxID=1965302 RepID=UPI002CEBC334|nr:nucleotide sugar dehydrogenase [Romboutsia sp.]HSQ89741.1 nucleotide sugar dehydrogenase [Romboutsia sp.]